MGLQVGYQLEPEPFEPDPGNTGEGTGNPAKFFPGFPANLYRHAVTGRRSNMSYLKKAVVNEGDFHQFIDSSVLSRLESGW